MENGLPHNYVHSIIQDKTGFLWIATNYGLARFDGNTFKVFRPDPEKPKTITHKPIGNVYEDLKGNLWLSINSGGVNRMNLKNEEFKGYFSDITNQYPLGKDISVFYEDQDSTLWIFNQIGIYKYDPKKDALIYTFSKEDKKFSSDYVFSYADDQCGNIWFVYDNKVGILNKKTFKTSTIGEYTSNRSLDTIFYTYIQTNEKGKIWLCTKQHGLLNYDVLNHKFDYYLTHVKNLIYLYFDRNKNMYAVCNDPTFELFAINKENISKKIYRSCVPFGKKDLHLWLKIIDDRFGDIWISSSAGLAKYNFINGLTQFKANNFDANSISDNSFENIFIDKTDNLWLCPFRKGLNKADLLQKPFKLYFREVKNLNDLLTDRKISSVFEDRYGNIWMGNADNGITINFKKDQKYYDYQINNTDLVTAIFEDRNKNIWIGTFWGKTFKINSPEVTSLYRNPSKSTVSLTQFNIPGVRKIAEDSIGNLWFASIEGLICLDKSKNEIINYSKIYDKLNEFSWFSRTLIIDKNQVIWTGSNNGGLCKFDIKNKKFTHFLHLSKSNNSISNNTVYAIYKDPKNKFWIGTGQGLEKFDPETQTFEHQGGNILNKLSIFSVLPDTSNNLWMSTDNGIAKYNITNNSSFFYGEADGLQNSEYATTASFLSTSGELYFGGTKGLISFNPSLIKTNPIHSKPIITSLSIYNRVVNPGDTINNRIVINKPLWNTDKITLFHFETAFTIEFSALHYAAPEKVSYYYKLEGLNNEWSYTDVKRRFASYTGLPPGDYTFVLKSTNNDGLMCKDEDIARLNITITPPFWQTLWFRIFVIIGLVGLLLLFISYRLKSLQRKNLILDRKVKERTFELEQANKSLEVRTHELEEVNAILEERQEEINLQKEEIQTQYETLENTNELLQQQQQHIIEQNIELDKHRNKLEFLVEERTRELERALAKAEESDRLKSSFLTNMSHEIRTPMNAIIGFSSLLKDESLMDKKEEFINIIEVNGRSLLTLINDILELSSMQSQQVSLKPVNNNLYSLLKKVYDIFKIETDKHNLSIKLNAELIDESFAFNCDEVRLQQMLSNLLANALKFTDTGGLEFGLLSINDKITFYVKDTGIGIPKEIGNAIFERFYKIEHNKNQLFRGTGLGLAICKNIVSLWNGEIWYESEIGKGTTFYFTYPITSNSNENLSQTKQSQNEKIDFSDKCILIAEDEESNFKLLFNYLKNTNSKILWAKNGAEALELVFKNKVHIVLLDIKMPVINGFEVTKKLRQSFPNIPIIAQTAFAFKNEIQEILECGVNAYLTKPINKNELLDMVKKYIS